MKNKQNRCTAWVSRLVLGLGVGAALFLPSVATAQADPTADETIWGDETASVSGDSGAASSLMDIIQRGQVGPTQSRADFLKKQDENLNDAAAAFRARQLEAFKTPAAPDLESPESDEQLQSQAIDEAPRRALW